MIKLRDILLEIADTPYYTSPPKEDKMTAFSNIVDYEFETDTDREYYIRFSSNWQGRSKKEDQKYNWATELTFFPKKLANVGEPGEVGGENFGKILATVASTLKEYVRDYKPEYVFWKGIKSDEESKSGEKVDVTKRQRIYNALLKRSTSSITGYESQIGDVKSWLIYDGEIPIKDSSELFKYPEEPYVEDPEKSKQKLSRFNFARS